MRKITRILLLLVVAIFCNDTKKFVVVMAKSPPVVVSFSASGYNDIKKTPVTILRGGSNTGVVSTRNAKKTTSPLTIPMMAVLQFLNASSKWILATANLIGVAIYKEEGAFIVLGCIVASFFTEKVLKPIINQGRPIHSPLADPGMPSSHSLSSFFVAIAWTKIIGNQGILIGIATIVASLRIICGYHTAAQIGIGAILGLLFGEGWMMVFRNTIQRKLLLVDDPSQLKKWIWCTYVSGSVLFIWKIMSQWVGVYGSKKKNHR